MTEATREGASAAEQLMARWSEPDETNEPENDPEPDDPDTTAEPDAGGDDEPDAGAEPEESEAQYDLSEIASVLGYDESDLAIDEDGKVKVKVKIDGEERLATPAELRKSYQLEGHLNKNNMEVAEQRKALQAKEQELTQTYQQKLTEAQNLAQVAYQQLAQEYQSIDWDKLRAEDPNEWVIQRQSFQERNAQIQNNLQAMQQHQQQMAEQHRKQEYERLLDVIPEWKNPEVFQEDSRKIVRELGEYGYSKQEAHQIVDHRFFRIVRDAMRYRELQTKKPETTKKVKKAPKVVKPGQPVTKNTNEQRMAQLKKKIQKGERGSVAGLLMERWNQK